ncbi:MAG: serine dehydratase subunit alpha family protein [Lachnospiraceae bacterium]|nr:serine dehydratase subunit alpha family protein [Lachnospiraceae bacterium]
MLTKAEYDNYVNILKRELVPAMGCTEPIAIAFAAAKARAVLDEDVKRAHVHCSGNIIKNVKGVTVPNSGGLKGIEAACLLGIIGGNADNELEVVSGATDEARELVAKKVREGVCDVSLVEDVPNLYIRVCVEGEHHSAEVELTNAHTNITRIVRDRETVYEANAPLVQEDGTTMEAADYGNVTLRGLLAFADEVNIDDVREVLDRQIACNSAISQEGLDNPWGARVGKTILETWGGDVKSTAVARAAAGSDARMSGCPLPVVINSGSGNQGITVTLPVLEYASAWHISDEKRYRALIVANLVSIHIKHYIGALSAFCGAVSAACGAGAAITYMSGNDYAQIARTITNTIGNVGGIVCDGAKPSCAAKIAASVHAALLAHYMSLSERAFSAGEGIVEADVEETIRNMGYIGKVGMKDTDREILNIMTNKADVDGCL